MREWIKFDKAIDFNLEATAALRGPGVYAYLNGDKAVYVGSSKKVIGRALGRNHHLLKELASATSLLVFPCKDWEEAKALESQMICDLRPALNMRNGKMYRAKDLSQALGTTTQHVVHQYLTRKDA